MDHNEMLLESIRQDRLDYISKILAFSRYKTLNLQKAIDLAKELDRSEIVSYLERERHRYE